MSALLTHLLGILNLTGVCLKGGTSLGRSLSTHIRWVLYNEYVCFYQLLQIYYILGVIEDLVFRSLWTVDIFIGSRGLRLLDSTLLGTIKGILEIFRRFVWNFFRLENEHLNNVGEFRAVRDISIRPVDLTEVDGVDNPEVTMTTQVIHFECS